MGKQKESTSYCQAVTAFIACSKTKKAYSSQARYLYQGSLFKKALKYAEKNYKFVYILSAKHGVVSLEQILNPYEKTLNNMNKQERKEWNKLVTQQIQEKNLKRPFVFFTGKLYRSQDAKHLPRPNNQRRTHAK